MMRFALPTGLLVLATASILSLAGPALAAGDVLKPGKWEILTSGTTDQGGQKIEMPETKAETCIAPQESQQSAATEPDPTCQVETLEKSGGKMVTRATCGDIVSDTTMTWNDDAYESVTHMVMTSGSQTVMVSDMTSKGRYLGSCEG